MFVYFLIVRVNCEYEMYLRMYVNLYQFYEFVLFFVIVKYLCVL